MENNTSSKKDIISLCDEIYKSSLFRISLSSMELFHSNVWHWFAELNPKLAYEKFGCVNCEHFEDLVFFRESRNMDFTIASKIRKQKGGYYKSKFGYHAFVENKIKSIIDKRQLVRYFDAIEEGAKKSAVFIVVSLFPQIEQTGDWQVWSYKNIQSWVSDILRTNSLDKDQRYFIDQYKQLIALLIALADALTSELVSDKYNFIYSGDKTDDVLNALSRIRFLDVYRKYRASCLAKYCYERIIVDRRFKGKRIKFNEIESVENDLNIQYGYSSMAHAGLSEAVTFLKSTDARIGFQMQAESYNTFLEIKDAVAHSQQLIANNIWFEDLSSRKNKGFHRFGDSFLYQIEHIKFNTDYETIYQKTASKLKLLLDNKERIISILGL